MKNILCKEPGVPCGEESSYIVAFLDKDQASVLAKAIQELLSIKAVLKTFNAGSDMILQDFANEIEERSKHLE